MLQIIFLVVLAFIWILFASIQDLRKKEIANWVNFSLIIFALGFRFFYSLFQDFEFGFFYQGVIGFGIFFLLGNLFYYSKIFAGGDAKLMYSLGAILPFSKSFLINFKIFVLFLLLFLLVGMIYGLIASFFLMLKNFKNFKKEFKIQIKLNKKLFFSVLILGLVLMVFGFFESLWFVIGVMIFVLPYLYLYSKAIDESCMVKKIKVQDLTEGDWLYKNIKCGKELIKASWEGLSKKEIKFLQKSKRVVLIKQGIAYAHVFLISFIILVILFFSDSINFLDWFLRF